MGFLMFIQFHYKDASLTQMYGVFFATLRHKDIWRKVVVGGEAHF